MNIFYIPGRYPNRTAPDSHSFIKDQALAIGAERQDCRIFISLWGQGAYCLYAREPFISLKKIIRYLKEKGGTTEIAPNVIEVFNPTLEWSSRFFNTNINHLFKINADNFMLASEKFGAIDLIHAHLTYPAGYLAMKLSRKFSVPYVITEHSSGFLSEMFKKNGRLIETYASPLKQAERVMAVGPALQQRLIELGIPRVEMVPNVIDEDFFFPASAHGTNRPFTFFTLCNMWPSKGVSDLLKSISLVVEQKKDIRFRIAGVGQMLETHKKEAADLQIQDYINWLGAISRTEIRGEFQACDAFILTSHYETFGMVYAEAIACGKPVIATRCGGPDIIVSPVNGILVDIGQIKDIAEAILRMADQAGHFDSKKIRQEFLEKFAKKTVVNKIYSIYLKSISEVSSHEKKHPPVSHP